ncbi:trypsin-like peptidase domain-containing protein [Candidatus Saccharibacteria bacterium]|nr:trypsin-like peptidase domain-containing protein [Candidatus Saccharibacteria bacterium]
MSIVQFNKPKLPGLSFTNLQNRIKRFSFVVLCGLIGFGGGLLGAQISGNGGQTAKTIEQKQQVISSESELISEIAKKVGQSVVSVEVESETSATDFFGFVVPQRQASAGTGFIISAEGVIVTNRHVVPAGATKVSITMADGTQYANVQVLGRTSENNPLDVAFLKISDLKGKSLTPVTIGDSSKMEVGDRVIAIGNALGQFQNTVTEGIISGHGRSVVAADQSGAGAETLTDLFQTDAAINQGNSGGPLVNISGEVIAINTAIAGGAENIGFAIPINDVKGLIDGVLRSGKLQQAYLGVRYVSLTDDLAYQYNLDVKRGAYIVPSRDSSSVVAGSPAEKAGLKEKDIITKVNNITIDEKTSLTAALSRFQVGENVTLTIVRDDKTITVRATLEAAPSEQ